VRRHVPIAMKAAPSSLR